jgi:predicted lipoprotein with Yx(FWY)xxD motif
MNRLTIAAAATAALGLATLTGCYGQDDASNGEPAPAGVVTASLSATDSDSLGAIVTDAEGRTLYRFEEDSAEPSVSNCAGDCAAKWPPALAGSSVRVDGVAKDLVGTVTRADGRKQLTLNGWPLYYFHKDKELGQTAGYGVNGVWFAIAPDGKKAALCP